jgi:hypothetical protein
LNQFARNPDIGRTANPGLEQWHGQMGQSARGSLSKLFDKPP